MAWMMVVGREHACGWPLELLNMTSITFFRSTLGEKCGWIFTLFPRIQGEVNQERRASRRDLEAPTEAKKKIWIEDKDEKVLGDEDKNRAVDGDGVVEGVGDEHDDRNGDTKEDEDAGLDKDKDYSAVAVAVHGTHQLLMNAALRICSKPAAETCSPVSTKSTSLFTKQRSETKGDEPLGRSSSVQSG